MQFNIRSSGLINDFGNKIFHILGCGAIGSSAATQLCRMGVENFILYDMDKVGVENIGVSQFTTKDIGRSKVQALKRQLLDINSNISSVLSDGEFKEYFKKLDSRDVVIIGFDNMAIRKQAAELALSRPNKPFLLIDGRMGAEQYQQYVFVNPKLKDYMKYWYDDDSASTEPCNAKATSYCSNMSGSFIANAVKKVMNNEGYSKEFFFQFPNYSLGRSSVIH
tara:strand:- start:310 stop:975 length:666 start_codon:yes stop_codon:yes gene_type:complete